MDVSFAQYVAAIDLHHVEPPPPAPLKGSSSSSAPAPAPAPAAAVDLPITGSFHLLSDVTRKLVITPAFLIGQRRSTATSAAASFGAATTPVEDLYELEPNY